MPDPGTRTVALAAFLLAINRHAPVKQKPSEDVNQLRLRAAPASGIAAVHMTKLFLGIGAGRCGTMALANLLNNEPGVTCLHEGKVRVREQAGEKLLPFLTLQNHQAYEKPETAAALFVRYRGDMAVRGKASGSAWFGDVAYNYAPFLAHVPAVLPGARVFVVFRNGVDFVRSATTLEGDNPAPLGWPPRDRSLNDIETFIGLGRWRPRVGERWHAEWTADFDHFERNAWLWAETNRVLLDALDRLDPAMAMRIRFEDFFQRLPDAYGELRDFLGLPSDIGPEVRKLLKGGRINQRSVYAVPHAAEWDGGMRKRFAQIAGDVMERLGYSLP